MSSRKKLSQEEVLVGPPPSNHGAQPANMTAQVQKPWYKNGWIIALIVLCAALVIGIASWAIFGSVGSTGNPTQQKQTQDQVASKSDIDSIQKQIEQQNLIRDLQERNRRLTDQRDKALDQRDAAIQDARKALENSRNQVPATVTVTVPRQNPAPRPTTTTPKPNNDNLGEWVP